MMGLRFHFISLFFILFFFLIFNQIIASSTTLRVVVVGDKQCNDGIDNDGDNLIDYLGDPGCDTSIDDDESNPSTGGGGGSGGGGGGGGGTTVSSQSLTGVIFRGVAYPNSSVFILKNGSIVASTISGPDARFDVLINNISSGNYTFSIYATDANGMSSTPKVFSISLISGSTATVSDIFLSPTISTDKVEVRRGDPIVLFGQGAPESKVTIVVNSENEIIKEKNTDTKGVWSYQLDSILLENGDHEAKSRISSSESVSPFSKSVFFKVGNVNKNRDKEPNTLRKGDLNSDGKVNLVDFSIAAFWYRKQLSGDIIERELERLNADSKIDLKDFSIIAYWWTG